MVAIVEHLQMKAFLEQDGKLRPVDNIMLAKPRQPVIVLSWVHPMQRLDNIFKMCFSDLFKEYYLQKCG